MGYGVSFGAVSVLNAIPTGIGATIGIDLKTEAVFETGGNGKITGTEKTRPGYRKLLTLCVEAAYRIAGEPEPDNWTLSLTSEIPPSKGLKSSSSVCNAVIFSVLDELDVCVDELTVLKAGVDCARRGGVTVTGAFDDACGCHFGGYVMTDNRKDEILFLKDFPECDVVLHVPPYVSERNPDLLKAIAAEQAEAVALAETDPFAALTLNGKLVAKALGINNGVAETSLRYGALAAGISGSGPATAVLLEKDTAENFMKKTGLRSTIVTKTRKPYETKRYHKEMRDRVPVG